MRVGRRLDKVLHTEAAQIETLSAVPALSVLDAEIFERRDLQGVGIAETESGHLHWPRSGHLTWPHLRRSS